jgi:peptidylprolyl isomerase
MPTPCPNADGSSEKRQRFDEPLPMCIDPTKRYTAELTSSLGAMTIALDAAGAPRTVNNFVVLARYHYYDGIIFHRIIKGFMCQGGDPTGTGRGGPGYQFADELPQPGRYEVGSLAMANAGPDTNGSQFFIVSGPSGCSLPPKYSLFGKVVKGLDVLAEMEAVETDRSDRPRADVVIQSVTVTEAD